MSDFQTELVALLGPLCHQRCYPNHAPDPSQAPYVIYSRISARPQTVLDPAHNSALINTHCQLDVYANSYTAAITLSEQIKTRLTTWSLQNSLSFEQDFYEPEQALHRVMLEISVWHG